MVRIDAGGVTVKPFEATLRVGLGTTAWRRGFVTLNPHVSWKGRTINALGEPIDGGGPLAQGARAVSTEREPPAPMRRQRVRTPVKTGVKVIDLFTPLCAGQRIGIFAGSGIGKSTLLGMLARSQGFDMTVIALVGERGREVREFMEDVLGRDRARAVTVVATGDESPMMRRLAPKTAMSIAEHFRDRGDNVLLILDSMTRFAHAARDVGLAAGEPPVARGYTPERVHRLAEAAGAGRARARKGRGRSPGYSPCWSTATITTIRSPTASAARSTATSCSTAPSPSRRAIPPSTCSPPSRGWRHGRGRRSSANLVMKLRAMVARFEDTRDLRLMGGYRKGTDAALDRAIELVPRLYEAMKQGPAEPACADVFQEIARALAAEPAGDPAGEQPRR